MRPHGTSPLPRSSGVQGVLDLLGPLSSVRGLPWQRDGIVVRSALVQAQRRSVSGSFRFPHMLQLTPPQSLVPSLSVPPVGGNGSGSSQGEGDIGWASEASRDSGEVGVSGRDGVRGQSGGR